MNAEDAIQFLREANPEAVTFTGCDSALIGTCFPRQYGDNNPCVAVYSRVKLIEHFAREFSCEENPIEAAIDWIDYSVEAASYGVHTPIIVDDE